MLYIKHGTELKCSDNQGWVVLPKAKSESALLLMVIFCATCHVLCLQCLLFLEKELVTLGAMCAASLLKEDMTLPFAGTSTV